MKRYAFILFTVICLTASASSLFALGSKPPPPPPVASIDPASPEITLLPADTTGCSAATAETRQAVQLRKMDKWLVDNHGRVVLLHGMNAVFKNAPFYPPGTADGFTEQDARWLYDNGFNTVRAGTVFEGVMPQKGVIDDAYLGAWDRIIQLLADNKQWTLLDFHQDMYNGQFQGNGFPDWAVYDYRWWNLATMGFPLNYFTEVVSRQYDRLYQNVNGVAEQYGVAWQAVAEKWKDQDYLMGYDLINEPWPGTCWPDCIIPFEGCPQGDKTLQAFQTGVLNAIRDVDDENIVWFEPTPLFDFGFPNHFDDTGIEQDDQLGFSFHAYCLSGMVLEMVLSGVEGVPGCDVSHQIVMRNAEKTMNRMDAAGVLSEFGASDDVVDLRRVTAEADANLLGWQYWHYKNWEDPTTQSQETGAQGLFENNADLSSLKTVKARVLIRPYPQYTAGIPTALSFDPDASVMYYEYVPRNTSARTEIYVPTHIHYPNGYSVTAKGAADIQVTENGRRLLIEEAPGACKVIVEIVPY
jgi:endoglycosylceramidase